MKKNRILWVHNFDVKVQNSGVFMFNSHQFLLNHGMKIDLYYAGNLRSVKNLFKQLSAIRKKADDYQIIHAQFGSMLGFLVKFSLIGLDVNKVVSLRGSDFYRNKMATGMMALHSAFAVFLTKISIFSFDKVVVASERMKRELIKNSSLDPHKIEVQPSPVNVNRFDIGSLKNYSPKKKILFGAVNTKSEMKRYQLAKEAVDIVKNNTKGKYVVEMIVAEKIPHEDMNNLYNSSDLLVITSLYEGWPNVVKEALSCGVPFVATDMSDMALIAARSNGTCRTSCANKFELAKHIEDSLSKPLKQSDRLLLRSLVIDMSFENSMKNIERMYASLNDKG